MTGNYFLFQLYTLFEKEQIESFRKAFSLFDKNGDGQIQTKELRSALRNLGQNPTDFELQSIFNEMDIDRNGTIDFTEFVKMFIKTYKHENKEIDFKAVSCHDIISTFLERPYNVHTDVSNIQITFWAAWDDICLVHSL